jgi:hypothetical protein
MKRICFIISTVLILLAFFLACSQDSNPIPSSAHTDSWTNVASEDFHGTKVLEVGFESCTSCHGKDYQGGESKVSCFKCHDSYPHSDDWLANSDFSHNDYLKANSWDGSSCADCHGDNFTGGNSKVSCYTCHNYPHNDSWLLKTSSEFHGVYIKNKEYDISSCANCHGENFGGGNTEISCYTCHGSYPHNENWTAGSDLSHGPFVKGKEWSNESCQSCHGTDLLGGSSDISCYTCHNSYPHSNEWLVSDDESFHGLFVKNSGYDISSCASCHGGDFMGGNTEVSCYTCHKNYPHQDGWTSPSNENFHGQAIQAANWSMENCTSCHGEDYRGGSSGASCFKCHTGDEGPETCNTCHGSSVNFAPPQDLSDNTSTTALGVGAHQLHMVMFDSCFPCHNVPTKVSDEGHIDSTPNAEVKENWGWDRNSATCTSLCHQNPEKSYIWNSF